MAPREDDLRAEVCDVCRRLHGRNLLAAADGNVSVRLEDGTIAITPSGVAKNRMAPGDLALLDPDGTVLAGRPSTERLMHLAVYRACPEARAVVHAHPPTAIALSLARPDWAWLPSDALPEVILAAGAVPIVPYARPGTAAMGEVLAPFLPERRLLMLSRHGALAWGEDLEEAYRGVERLEHVCQILKAALELGGAAALPPEEVEALREARARNGRRLL
ncbi:class II aldolase/adducin family protein [Mesoterricola sediminis]|uniref:Aldolase n=1 Tax=Mesoterricola sediminis TaxID=2927980 RepID=A0AA48GUP1_9BACT|nr:class II aldolase/adducin family protein [Mesoterricola sediminis]BDU75970.1 aldolase [Mesoterricola sediminis]